MAISFDEISLKKDDIDFVIYHDNCIDGFGSALSAQCYMNKKYPDKKVTYVPAKYGDKPQFENIKGKNILICDFSYKLNDLLRIIEIAKNVLILDHHKTAEIDLKGIPEKYKVFRMDHSGAYLTWCYFHGSDNIPLVIRYIEDNDIWTKKMYKTNEFTSYIMTIPRTFEEYEKLLDDDYVLNYVLKQGEGMIKQNLSIISTSIKYAAPKFSKIGDKYYFVAYLNSSVLRSELGNTVFSETPYINFSAIYSMNDYNNSTSFSLRSIDTATDVSEIAKLFGGGGHRNASGCSIKSIVNTLPSKIIDIHKSYFILENIYFKKFGQLNLCYLNSYHYKHDLAKFLLQERSNGVQECVNIKKVRDHEDLNFTCNMAILWNYDGKKTWFTVKSIIDIKKIAEHVLNYEYTDEIHKFSVNEFNIDIHDLLCKINLV